MRRAYSLVQTKDFDQTKRTFTGTATSPVPDRVGDVIETAGVTYKNPLPLLLYHDREKPVGEVRFLRPGKDGDTPFSAVISSIDREGVVKQRLDEAVDSLNANPPLIRGVSIGFRPLEEPTYDKATGGFRFTKIEVLELSLVVVPAHQLATVSTVKSFDTDCPAASGPPQPVQQSQSPSVLGPAKRMTRKDGAMTRAERIASFQQEKAAKITKLNALVDTTDNSTLTPEQSEEFDTLKGEIKALDEQCVRLEEAETLNKSMVAAAVPVVAATPAQAATSRAGLPQVTVTSRLEKGQLFARYAMCIAASKGNLQSAFEMSKSRYPDNPEIHTVLKAAVAAGTTLDSTWAGSLVQYRDIAEPFLEYLRPMTIIDRIPGFTRVPFKVRYGVQSAGASATWVGEAKPKPLSKSGFTTGTLDFHKVATIAVLTEEEVRFSSPSAELKVRNDLARAVVARMDQDFIDPTNAGTANVKPASITYGIAAVAATGTTADHAEADLATVLTGFANSNLPIAGAVVVMSATVAIHLSLMRYSLGNRVWPDMTPTGGSILGMPVIVSQYLHSLGSPGTGMIVVFRPEDIFVADDGNVTVDASREASVEMLDGSLTQDGTNGTGASLVSLWQNNLVGLRAEREITWKRGRDASVAYISNVAYVV